MDEYYRYLAGDMRDIEVEDFAEFTQSIVDVCVALSIVGDIDETHFRLYTDGLFGSDLLFKNTVAYFSGLGKINVICDCDGADFLCDTIGLHSGPNYDRGVLDRLDNDDEWQEIEEQIDVMIMELNV